MPSYSVQISSRPINGEHLEDPRFHCHYPHLGPAQINGEPLRGARANSCGYSLHFLQSSRLVQREEPKAQRPSCCFAKSTSVVLLTAIVTLLGTFTTFHWVLQGRVPLAAICV